MEGLEPALEYGILARLRLYFRAMPPTLITVGIYWPAAALRLYAYFVGRTVFERSGQRIGRLGFEGKIGKGFGLIWGQGLLCLITLGIYIPWGYSKVLRWIAGNSYYERL